MELIFLMTRKNPPVRAYFSFRKKWRDVMFLSFFFTTSNLSSRLYANNIKGSIFFLFIFLINYIVCSSHRLYRDYFKYVSRFIKVFILAKKETFIAFRYLEPTKSFAAREELERPIYRNVLCRGKKTVICYPRFFVPSDTRKRGNPHGI